MRILSCLALAFSLAVLLLTAAPRPIRWSVTFEDPKFFTAPWSVTLPITRQNTEIMSYSCEENEKDRAHLQRAKKP